ncbi:sosondowah [Carabus blaptoides fortunei]
MALSELSLDAIHEYILGKGGKVANRELVHHFKKYLINADKNEARIRFKEYVNKIACSKTENGEKFIILRTKYASALTSTASTPVSSPLNTVGIPSNLQDVSPVPSPSKARHPPPYRPPPPVSSPSLSIDNISLCSSSMSIKDMEEPPQAPPRRKSQSSRTLSVEVDEPPSQQQEQQQQQSEPIAIPQSVENSEQAISVKERTQKFNRLASVENDLSPQPSQTQKERRRQAETGADEDDGASVTSLDNKRTEWVVAAARGDYQALAKLATANPRLVKTKAPPNFLRPVQHQHRLTMSLLDKLPRKTLTELKRPKVSNWSEMIDMAGPVLMIPLYQYMVHANETRCCNQSDAD